MSELFSTKDGLVRASVSAAISAGAAVLLLFLSCFILMFTEDPAEYATVAAIASLFISAAVTGAVSVRITGNVYSGILTGVFISLILYLLSVFFFEREISAGARLALHVAYVALSFAASFFGRKKKSRNARLKHIRRKR